MTEPVHASVRAPRCLQSIRPIAAFLVGVAKAFKVPVADTSLFENAIVEALNNALAHNAPAAEAQLFCEIELDRDEVAIRITDEAATQPVELRAVPLAQDPHGSCDIPEHGYGLHVIQAVFPRIRPIARDGRHGVEMRLALKEVGPPAEL